MNEAGVQSVISTTLRICGPRTKSGGVRGTRRARRSVLQTQGEPGNVRRGGLKFQAQNRTTLDPPWGQSWLLSHPQTPHALRRSEGSCDSRYWRDSIRVWA